jgi:PPP family 3-phenylpropionic acid transporter
VSLPDNAQRRLSLLAAALSAIGGVQVAFFPIWMGARGLDGADIALILSASPAIRIVANLVSAHLGDATGAYGRLIALHAAATAATLAIIGLSHGFYPLLFWLTALAFVQGPIGPLNDGLVLGELHRRRALGLPPLDFAAIRGWGSASVLIFMLGAGRIAGALPADALIWIMTAIGGLSAVASFYLVRGFSPGRRAASETPVPDSPLRRPGLIALIIACAAVVHGSHGFLTVFASLHWAARGFDPTFISIAWATSTSAEILFFLAVNRWLGGEKRAVSFLMIGSAGAVLRWAIYANDPAAPAAILAAQCLTTLSGSAMGLGAAWLIAELGGTAYTARVHGWLGAAFGAALTFGLYVSGPLEAAYGQKGYLAMSAMAGVGLVLSFFVAAATRDGILPKNEQADRSACPKTT